MSFETCSEVISFSKKLELESAQFYQEIADKFPRNKDVFISFAAENKKNITTIERVYYGVITDAIEGCFAFNVDPSNYIINYFVPDVWSKAIEQANCIEKTLIEFYIEAAEQSKSLMADIPRTFTIIAKQRDERINKLKSLVEKGS